MTRTLQRALRYAAAGWPVFPCAPGAKVPLGILVPHGCLDATTDPDVIRAWWIRAPTANVAIATGTPGPDVVDFDVKPGQHGEASFRTLRDAGLLAGASAVVTTPSGGWHLYFAGTDQGNGSIPGAGVDFRGRGGYVLAVPSRISDPFHGGEYVLSEWRRSDTANTVDWQAIRNVLRPAPPRPTVAFSDRKATGFDGLVRQVADTRHDSHNRNNVLHWAACRAVDGGADETVFAALAAAAESNGLAPAEVDRTIESARRRVAA